MTTTMPENFPKIISDMLSALTDTFPEYAFMWQKWTMDEMLLSPEMNPDDKIRSLFDYCTTVYPARFFDIIYQNEEMFKLPSNETMFLPDVDFTIFFDCKDITQSTKQTLWKYLQLMLFTISGSINDKSNFGDAAKKFESIDQNDLHEKIVDTIKGMSEFFNTSESSVEKDLSGNNVDNNNSESGAKSTNIPDIFGLGDGVFNSDGGDVHEHLKGLFDGKIGSLAKDLAEDISKDFSSILGDDTSDIKTSKDILHRLMKNPAKISELVKTIGVKLTNKMDSGEVSQDELMKEAMGLIGKFKDMGDGNNQFGEIFKNISKMAGMPNIPKMPTNDNDMDLTMGGPVFKKPSNHGSMRDKLKARLIQKQQAMQNIIPEQVKSPVVSSSDVLNQNSSESNGYNIRSTGVSNNYVFSLDDSDKQLTSGIEDRISDEGEQLKPKKKNNKKKKNK